MTAVDDTNRHAFKNQLAIIRGFAELLLAEAAPGDSPRAELEEIHRAAEKALQLLDRLYPSGADLAPS
jgi:signal transduction histidine kinase